MAQTFFGLLTKVGEAKDANAKALGIPLKYTHMAVGDGNGVLPVPDPNRTTLVNEQRRAQLNLLYQDPLNANQIIAEQVIPENEGGWWIRELGLFDEDGDLIAIANCPESYKPILAEGSGRTQTVRMVLIISAADQVVLKIDPSIVLATRKFAEDKAIEVVVAKIAAHEAKADPHPQYLLAEEAPKSFDANTTMVFIQETAPTGWTKSVAHDNKALRIVSGATGGQGGGTVDFSTAFVNKAISGTVDATTLTVAQMPSHSHGSSIWRRIGGPLDVATNGGSGFDSATSTDAAGSGGSHTHTLSGATINLAVKYVDSIIATKD